MVARRNHQTRIFYLQRRQSWAVLGLILASVVIDWLCQAQGVIAKSTALGASLAYVAQSAFTYVAYRTVGARFRQVIMLNMYLGQMLKWLLTLVGFALIFMMLKPISALAVMLGYVLMQIVHVLVMWRFT